MKSPALFTLPEGLEELLPQPWAETADAIAEHMVFGPTGETLLQVTVLQLIPPERVAPEPQDLREGWGLCLRAELQVTLPDLVTTHDFSVHLPLSTPRGTWVVFGVEVVPALPDADMDVDLSRRIRAWFTHMADREGQRVLRRRSAWTPAPYRVDLSRLIRRFIDQAVERASTPGLNRLAHHHLLHSTGRTRKHPVFNGKTGALLESALPVVSGDERTPGWLPGNIGESASAARASAQAGHEARLPTVPIRLGVDPHLPRGSAELTASAARSLQASVLHFIRGRVCGEDILRRVPDLSAEERAALDPRGVVRLGVSVQAGQRILVRQKASEYSPGERRDISLRAPCAAQVIAVTEVTDPDFQNRFQRVRITLAATNTPQVGDPIGLLHSTGRSDALRVSHLQGEGDLRESSTGRVVDVLVHPEDGEGGIETCAVRLLQSPVLPARRCDVPAIVLANSILCAQLLGEEACRSHPCEWGARWSSPPVLFPPWTPGRRVQNLLGLFGCALVLDARGVGVIPVAPADLLAASQGTKGKSAHDILGLLRSLGPRRARHVRHYIRLTGEQRFIGSRERVLTHIGLPMLDLLLRKGPRRFEPLMTPLCRLAALSGHGRVPGRTHSLMIREQGHLMRIWEEVGRALASTLRLRDRVAQASFTPVVASRHVRPGNAAVSPDLVPYLEPPRQPFQGLPLLVVGDRPALLQLVSGEGRGCIALHPDDHRELHGSSVFAMVLSDPAGLAAARELCHSPPEPPDSCWLDELPLLQPSRIPHAMEHVLETGVRAPISHPGTRRLFGCLDPQVDSGVLK